MHACISQHVITVLYIPASPTDACHQADATTLPVRDVDLAIVDQLPHVNSTLKDAREAILNAMELMRNYNTSGKGRVYNYYGLNITS